jgi:hypothetical protein
MKIALYLTSTLIAQSEMVSKGVIAAEDAHERD